MAGVTTTQTTGNQTKKLKKALGLFDVYAICTGAMFSSGFFLLPGLAAAQTGPSVALAYMIAGVLMLPAMFSMAELATAMPRAGGDYYFLDRAMGPLIGTIGGTGTYLALALKSAFALIGMGAYLALFVDVPIKPLAVVLTIAFTVLNIVGAKETTSLQRVLIVVLVSVMAVFMVGGVIEFLDRDVNTVVETQFDPFLIDGVAGLLGTVGFVFVSYAGLTKIASVAEEVQNPGRNIPLGMMLSIISTTIIYVVGVAIMVALLDANELRDSLTPVADAAEVALAWMPGELGIILIVASAVAAFASTGNAGILAASRYPMAMGRDKLIPERFARLSPAGTPVFSILFTSGLMMVAIVLLDESAIAKVASTFQLIIFMLVNFAVIVMRESRIEYYDPVYRTPLYPWMQVAGILASIFLISYIGIDAIALTVVVVIMTGLWYIYYARQRVARHGAIFHWFERLGENRYEGLEHELRDILKEKGLREEDPYDDVVTRAQVIDLAAPLPFAEIADQAAQLMSQRCPLVVTEEISALFVQSMSDTFTLVSRRAALPNVRHECVDHTELVIVRVRDGIMVDHDNDGTTEDVEIHALFFLVSPVNNPGQHLRILAQLSSHIETDSFETDWRDAVDEQELKEVLLHDERMVTLWINAHHRTKVMIGQTLRDLEWPEDTLVALIRRDNQVIIPKGSTILEDGDRITVLGNPDGVEKLFHAYIGE